MSSTASSAAAMARPAVLPGCMKRRRAVTLSFVRPQGRAPQGQDARGAVVGPGARAVVAVLGVDAELDEAVAAAALEDRRELFEEQLALEGGQGELRHVRVIGGRAAGVALRLPRLGDDADDDAAATWAGHALRARG